MVIYFSIYFGDDFIFKMENPGLFHGKFHLEMDDDWG